MELFHLGVKVKYIRDEWHFVCSVVLENKYVSVFTHRRWTDSVCIFVSSTLK